MAELARCANCGGAFVKRRSDHRFCQPLCRHAGERKPYDRPPPDPAQIARLFDDRPGSEMCREDEWHPTPDDGFAALDACCDSLETRRRWFLELRDRGMV
jgi:hypothetical protein